eukprot:COSAG06_NODE_67225_length_252_cov_1.006536_1_plen_45_part_10
MQAADGARGRRGDRQAGGCACGWRYDGFATHIRSVGESQPARSMN